jgi:UDP-N-acetylmuramate dehydrogenase
MRLLPQSAGSVRRTREERRARHPSEPSAGSFFKNPERTRGFGDSEMQGEEGERIPAGKLIEECGLVGRTVGGARVSEKHANFIVNTGGARFSDVLELAQVVKATVEQETGIELMEEVQMLPGPRK